MRLLMAVGGGGHFAPALAVVQSLKKKRNTILMVGRKYSLEGDKAISFEYHLARKNKINFKPIASARLQRKFTRYTLLSILKLPWGFLRSYSIIRSFKPNVTLCFGGYISFPVAVCSFLMGIPVVVHEQTLEAGLSNRIVSIFAKKACISWKSSRKFFPGQKTVLTGNPIRKFKIKSLNSVLGKNVFKDTDRDLPLLYITGGSLGSHVINEAVAGCLDELLEGYRIIHQTGDSKKYRDFDRLSKLKQGFKLKKQERYYLTKFIDASDIGSILEKADLVVSRSGINTVTEILYFGSPAILIPLPFSQKNEQMKNSDFLKRAGLAEIILQKDLSSDVLKNKISEMIARKEDASKNVKEAKKLLKPESAPDIVDVLEQVGQHKT